MDFEMGEKYFENHQYDLAFNIFKIIATDVSKGKDIRADSYNMMGTIISGFAPHLDEDDETGLKYFKKAIEIDPNNIGALLNIVDTFGNTDSMHNDREIFNVAYKRLLGDLSSKLSVQNLERLRKIYPPPLPWWGHFP